MEICRVKDVAMHYGVSDFTVRRWIHDGSIPKEFIVDLNMSGHTRPTYGIYESFYDKYPNGPKRVRQMKYRMYRIESNEQVEETKTEKTDDIQIRLKELESRCEKLERQNELLLTFVKHADAMYKCIRELTD